MIAQLLTQIPFDDEGAASGPFSLINGLPVHPLVLHGAVVFIPLAALGLLLMAVIPKFGAKFGWLVTGTAAVALVFAFITKESGEQLEKLVGEPGFDHGEWGERIPIVAGVLFVMTLILWLAQRSWSKKEGGTGLIVILGVVSVLIAGASMFMVYMAGDTGAKSVWEAEIAAIEAEPTAEASPTTAASPTATASPDASETASASPTSTLASYTMADVSAHNTSGDCWTVINNTVYDVTAWEDQHPGGAARIIQLCGIDGTSLFDGQHEGEPKPEQMLAGFEIGVLQ